MLSCLSHDPALRQSTGAHLPVQVGHSVGLNEPPPPTADERPRARGHARAVVSRRLLVLHVRTLCHPTTEEETHKNKLNQSNSKKIGPPRSVPADDAVHRLHIGTFKRANVCVGDVGGACELRLFRGNVLHGQIRWKQPD